MSSSIPPAWPLCPPPPPLPPLNAALSALCLPPLTDVPPLHLDRAHKRALPPLPHTPPAKRTCSIFKNEPATEPPAEHAKDLPVEPCSESTTSTSLSPSPSSSLPTNARPVPTDKFTKSRAVGQVHRDKERQAMSKLETDVDCLSRENVLLFACFYVHYKQEKDRSLADFPDTRVEGDMRLPYDHPEDFGLSDDEAEAKGWQRVCPVTAQRLGVRFLSPWMVRILLEYIAVRRNYVSVTGGPNRRRRSSVRLAPSVEESAALAEYARDMFMRQAFELGVKDVARFVDSKYGSLMYSLDQLSRFERDNNIPPFDDEDDDNRFPPKSPTRLDASEFGSPNRRRGEGAKRCSRCGAIKFTGSGHGRSKCDDGYSISSSIPYPASPRSEGTHSR